jgi:hypothetical protein
MRKVLILILVVVVVILVGLGIVFREQLAPMWSWASRWLEYWGVDLDLFARLSPTIVLVTGAMVELAVVVILNRHSRLFDREREALKAFHQEELELIRRELELAVKAREMTEARLRLRESLVREERAFLLLQLETTQRTTGLSSRLFVSIDPPQLSSGQVESLDQILNRLERIETADQAMGLEQSVPEVEKKQRAYDLLRLANLHYYLPTGCWTCCRRITWYISTGVWHTWL